MDSLLNIDWNHLFVPNIPIAESILRGMVVYFVVVFLVRFIPNRQMGALGMNDLLLVVLIASGATNALAGEYKSITNGIVLVATIIFWSYVFNWIGYRFPRINRLFQPAAKLLVKDGDILHDNMRRELVTEEELMGQLRQKGVNDVTDVQEAYVENDGQISVVKREPQTNGASERVVGK